MSRRTNRGGNPAVVDADTTAMPAAQTLRTGSRFHVLLSVIGIVVVTLASYLPVFDVAKEFTNWDDVDYVTSQPLIR